VNAGIAASESELIALLNNDTEADERWLDELVAALDETGYDSAASLMTFYDDPAVVNAAGDVYRMSQAVGANRGSLRQVAEYTQAVRVLGASAGAALYRRTLFDDVGLFDEDFFLIHEDTDLNLRALIAGKRCLYVPAALVRHKMSATIRTRPSSVILRQDMRNRGIVVAKDLPVALVAFAWLAWPWRLFRSTIPIRPSMWHLAPGLVKSLGMRVRSEAEGYRLGLLKRREVWRRQAIPTREVIRWLIRGVGPV
jgi:GT2 family glycosyltransferase